VSAARGPRRAARRRTLLAAFALGAALGAGCGGSDNEIPPPDSGAAPLVGYNDTLIPSEESTELLAESGADVVRRPLNWTAVEPQPGELQWGPTDVVYEQLADAGVSPIWTITSAPCWAAADPACKPNLPSYAPSEESFDAFAEFSAAVAERYPDSAGIEVWNEPNLERFYIGGGDARSYTELFNRTAAAIEATGSEVPVIAAGLSPVLPEQADGDRYAWEDYLETMIEGGVAENADGIGLHPYSAFEPGTEFIANATGQLRAAERIVGGEPIYVTEVGLTTAGPNAVTPEEQAEGLQQAYDTFAGEGVPLIVIHRFFDDSEPEFPAEAGYGVVAADRVTPKPAFCTVAELSGEPCAE
jgi:hypothetical protein